MLLSLLAVDIINITTEHVRLESIRETPELPWVLATSVSCVTLHAVAHVDLAEAPDALCRSYPWLWTGSQQQQGASCPVGPAANQLQFQAKPTQACRARGCPVDAWGTPWS